MFFLFQSLSLSLRAICFDLLFEHDYCIGIIFDSLIIATQKDLCVCFAEVMFDHVIVTELKGLSDIFQARLKLR